MFQPVRRNSEFRWMDDNQLNDLIGSVNTSSNAPTNWDAAINESVMRDAYRQGGPDLEQAYGQMMKLGSGAVNPQVFLSPFKPGRMDIGIANSMGEQDQMANPESYGTPNQAPYSSWEGFMQGAPDLMRENLGDSRRLGRQYQAYKQNNALLSQLNSMGGY